MMANLTRYQIGNRVIVSKIEYSPSPILLDGEIVAKAIHAIKVKFAKNYYFGEAQERWLSDDEWYVKCKLASPQPN